MPDKEIPQGAIRCNNGQYQAQCPECGEWIDVKSVEVKQPDRPDGQHPGYHTTRISRATSGTTARSTVEMPADVFPIGGALKGWPGAVGIEAWWYDAAPPQPWNRAAMPEPTVAWDQARCMILWASDRAPSGGQLRGTILNPGGGIIEIGQGIRR
jgi:hypothetical protein